MRCPICGKDMKKEEGEDANPNEGTSMFVACEYPGDSTEFFDGNEDGTLGSMRCHSCGFYFYYTDEAEAKARRKAKA